MFSVLFFVLLVLFLEINWKWIVKEANILDSLFLDFVNSIKNAKQKHFSLGIILLASHCKITLHYIYYHRNSGKESVLYIKRYLVLCLVLPFLTILALHLWAIPHFSVLSALKEGLTSKHLSPTEEPITFEHKERDWSSSVGRKIKVLTWRIADKERGAQSLKWCITESYPWVLGSIKRHYVHCSPPPFVCF